MSVGSAVGASVEEVQEELEEQDLLTPWAQTTATRIEYGGVSIDTDPPDQAGMDYTNDGGLDVTNTQIGTTGSAFTFNRRARGTIDAPEDLQNGDVVGWYAFGAMTNNGTFYQTVSGVQGTVNVDANGDTSGVLNFSVKRIADENPITAGAFLGNHDFQLTAYPSTRDDGISPTGKYLYFDTQGILRFGNISVYEFSGPEDDLNDDNDFATVLTVAAPGNGPAGWYELVASGEYSIDATGSDYEALLQQEPATILGQTVRTEGKDAAGAGVVVDGDNSGTDQRKPLYIRRLIQLPANSTQEFSYRHRPTANNVEASVFDLILTLEFKRPS